MRAILERDGVIDYRSVVKTIADRRVANGMTIMHQAALAAIASYQRPQMKFITGLVEAGFPLD